MTARESANGQRPPPPAKPNDWDRDSYRPAPDTPVKRCGRPGCGAIYIDDAPSRRAHVAVFGHSPKPAEPAAAPQDGQP